MANNPRAADNLIPCKPGETANPNGRPPSLMTRVNRELEAEGYFPANKNDITQATMTLVSMPKSKVGDIAKDENQPMYLRIIARGLLGKDGFEISEKVLDRALGKATQNIDSTNKNMNMHVVVKVPDPEPE